MIIVKKKKIFSLYISIQIIMRLSVKQNTVIFFGAFSGDQCNGCGYFSCSTVLLLYFVWYVAWVFWFFGDWKTLIWLYEIVNFPRFFFVILILIFQHFIIIYKKKLYQSAFYINVLHMHLYIFLNFMLIKVDMIDSYIET